MNSTFVQIDLLFKSSIASIFGYFLSANFLKSREYFEITDKDTKLNTNEYLKVNNISKSKPKENDTINKSNIGFITNDLKDVNEQNNLYSNSYENQNAIQVSSTKNQKIISTNNDRTQVLLVGALSIASIVILILIRHYLQVSTNAEGSVAQLRGFVSAGIGFLLGFPSDKNTMKQTK